MQKICYKTLLCTQEKKLFIRIYSSMWVFSSDVWSLNQILSNFYIKFESKNPEVLEHCLLSDEQTLFSLECLEYPFWE